MPWQSPAPRQSWWRQVKSGDITTHKQYQEALAQIKAEKERADAAEAERDKLLGAQNRAAWAESHIQDVEAQRDAALADVQGLTEQNAKLQQSYHDADESRIAANLQRQKAEAERDRAEARAKDAENQLAGSRQVAEAAKLRGDKLKAENDALKSQPITAVVDEEEVDRRAGEKAYQMAAEMTAELRAQLEQASSGHANRMPTAPMTTCCWPDRSFQNIWQNGKVRSPSAGFRPNSGKQLTNHARSHTRTDSRGGITDVCNHHGPGSRECQAHQGRGASRRRPPGSPSWAATTIRARPACWTRWRGPWAGTVSARTAAQRDGAIAPAHLKVTLSNGVVVERKGKNASLTVTDPTGRRSGQQLLNAFVEPLALDLPRFMEASDKEKADILLRIIGVGTELHIKDMEIKSLYDKRTFTGQLAATEKALCRGTGLLPGSPGRAGERLRAHPPAAGHSGPERREPAPAGPVCRA